MCCHLLPHASYTQELRASGVPRHANANDGSVVERPDLHEIAQLIRQPEAETADLCVLRFHPTDECVGDSSRVVCFAHDRAVVLPDLEHAASVCVDDAVA